MRIITALTFTAALITPLSLAQAEDKQPAPVYEVIEDNRNSASTKSPSITPTETTLASNDGQSAPNSDTDKQVSAEASVESIASKDKENQPEPQAAEETSTTTSDIPADTPTDLSPETNPQGIAYKCELANLIRRVEVDFLEPPAAVPCQVNYYKDNEEPGVQKTLWWAANAEGYCEEKAQNFVDKLIGLGWTCN